MSDRYSGDPRILITAEGADLDYAGGQPTMDQGLENQALLSLFTEPGWCGNVFLPRASRIGSDFQQTCQGAITLQAITADIPNAAERALASELFPERSVEVRNPQSYDLAIRVTLGPGRALLLDRRGMLWSAQAGNPAYRRLVKEE